MAIISTIHGFLDDSLLEKREGEIDNDTEHTTWVEYWQLVHRSAHVRLKTPAVFADSSVGEFSG